MEGVFARCFDSVLVVAADMDGAGELTHASCAFFLDYGRDAIISSTYCTVEVGMFVRINDTRALYLVLYSAIDNCQHERWVDCQVSSSVHVRRMLCPPQLSDETSHWITLGRYVPMEFLNSC